MGKVNRLDLGSKGCISRRDHRESSWIYRNLGLKFNQIKIQANNSSLSTLRAQRETYFLTEYYLNVQCAVLMTGRMNE
jgi:hypothetical protein